MPTGHHKLSELEYVEGYVGEYPLYKMFVFKNKRGATIKFGSKIYFIVTGKFGRCEIKQATVEEIAFVRGKSGKSVTPMIVTKSYHLHINDVYKSYEEAEGVINKWEEKLVNHLEKVIQQS